MRLALLLALVAFAALLLVGVLRLLQDSQTPMMRRALDVVIPIGVAAIFFFATWFCVASAMLNTTAPARPAM